MKTLTTVGRILFAVALLVFAVNPILHASSTAAVIPFPMATLFSYVAGILLLAGGVSLLLNKWTHMTMLFIAVLLVVRALTVHYPHFSGDDYAQQVLEVMNMTKDVALAGAALFMSGLAWNSK